MELEIQDLEGFGATMSDAERVKLARAFPFRLTVNFDSTISASGNGSASRRNNNDGTLLVAVEDLTAYIIAASGSAVAYSNLCQTSGETKNNNTWAPYSALRVEIFVDGKPWQDGPVRADLAFAQNRAARDPAMWRRIPSGATVQAKLYNDSGEAIQAQIMLEGIKIPD